MTCIFCDLIAPEQVLYETEHFRVVFDIDPIQTGHLLVLSKVHYQSLGELPTYVLHDLIELEAFLVKHLEASLPIDGVTRVSNDKGLMDAGTHFHIHLIPRQAGDSFWDSLDLFKADWEMRDFLDRLSKNHDK